METLAEAILKEQTRVRELLVEYKNIGKSGIFGAIMIEKSLEKTDQAVMSQDVAYMMAAYKDLQEIK